MWMWGDKSARSKKELEQMIAEAASEEVMQFYAAGARHRGHGSPFEVYVAEIKVKLVRNPELDDAVDQDGRWGGSG